MTRVRAIVIGVAIGLAAPASSFAAGLDLRFGGFFPRGESNLFSDVNELYGVRAEDFDGFTGGVEYSVNVSDHVEIGAHADWYGRHLDTVYRDFERDDGTPIFQELKLDIVPVGVSVRFLPAGRRAPVSPYLTVGADVFFYQYEEQGEFIDFFDDDLPISLDAFESDGATAGFHAAAGLRVPINHDWSITGEGRYQWAHTRMDDDFSLNELDLSGWSATVGVHLRF
jgi:hypothetical protein